MYVFCFYLYIFIKKHYYLKNISNGLNPDFLNRTELEPNFKLFFRTRTESNRTYDSKSNSNLNSILFIMYIVSAYKLNQP
jgi:hypothetical protein